MEYAFAKRKYRSVVYRETKNWCWPASQFAYMTVWAYLTSFITRHLLKQNYNY
jgi:ferrous iron transport protein B